MQTRTRIQHQYLRRNPPKNPRKNPHSHLPNIAWFLSIVRESSFDIEISQRTFDLGPREFSSLQFLKKSKSEVFAIAHMLCEAFPSVLEVASRKDDSVELVCHALESMNNSTLPSEENQVI